VTLATPGSLAALAARHWLALLYLAIGLLWLGGWVFDDGGGVQGLALRLAALLLTVQLLLMLTGDVMRRRKGLLRLLLGLLVLGVLGLAAVGVWGLFVFDWQAPLETWLRQRVR
jgi:hypothetical protein